MESKICIVCGKVFYKKLTTSKKVWFGSKYCSHSCQHIGITKNDRNRICLVCKKHFLCAPSNLNAKFCSRECMGKGVDYTKRPQYIPEAHDGSLIKCACGCGTSIPMYDRKFRRRKYVVGHTMIGKKIIRKQITIDRHRETMMKNGKLRGKGHWNWRGGITDEIRLLRHTPQYNNWRFAVYKRDKYHCIYCNKHCHEKDIVAHHIEDFKSNIKLRYDIGNGVTLCRKCHLNLHRNSIQLQVTLF